MFTPRYLLLLLSASTAFLAAAALPQDAPAGCYACPSSTTDGNYDLVTPTDPPVDGTLFCGYRLRDSESETYCTYDSEDGAIITNGDDLCYTTATQQCD
ncbi:hypothetical protein BDQ17DRAFT_1539499 [Cyathus striatus]|nr:hypothetical protein BDQ17DRAFT_1539499 [Cyathus striatus]